MASISRLQPPHSPATGFARDMTVSARLPALTSRAEMPASSGFTV